MALTLFTRDGITQRIAAGQQIVIFDGLVLRLDGWLSRHPGGETVIRHMVGMDGTDPVKQ